MISRQSSQTKTQAMEEVGSNTESSTNTPIRRNLSEEVQASSNEITENVIKALVSPQIRRISSDDHLPVLRKSAQICKFFFYIILKFILIYLILFV